MNLPADLRYSEMHEWVRLDGNRAVIGITEFAVKELGDIVFVELPRIGESVQSGEPFGSVESVKTVSELYAPLSGKVVEVNEQLNDAPQKVNEAPYNDGWMVTIELSDESELDRLWSSDKYRDTYSE